MLNESLCCDSFSLIHRFPRSPHSYNSRPETVITGDLKPRLELLAIKDGADPPFLATHYFSSETCPALDGVGHRSTEGRLLARRYAFVPALCPDSQIPHLCCLARHFPLFCRNAEKGLQKRLMLCIPHPRGERQNSLFCLPSLQALTAI